MFILYLAYPSMHLPIHYKGCKYWKLLCHAGCAMECFGRWSPTGWQSCLGNERGSSPQCNVSCRMCVGLNWFVKSKENNFTNGYLMKNEHDALVISVLSCALLLMERRHLHLLPAIHSSGLRTTSALPDARQVRSMFETSSSSKSTCLTPPACLLWLDNLWGISTSLRGSCDWAAALLGLPLEHRGTGTFLSLTVGFPSHDNVSSASDSQIHSLNYFFFLSHLGSSCKLPSSSARDLAEGWEAEKQGLLQCLSVIFQWYHFRCSESQVLQAHKLSFLWLKCVQLYKTNTFFAGFC